MSDVQRYFEEENLAIYSDIVNDFKMEDSYKVKIVFVVIDEESD